MEHTRALFAQLPPPSECLAILLGCAEVTVFGLAGLANPSSFATGYGIPLLEPSSVQTHPGALEKSPEERERGEKLRKTQQALIAAISARNVQNGVLMLTFALFLRDRRALGVATLLNVVTTFADAGIARAYGVQEAVFGHVIGVVNSLAVGGALLYWGRQDKWW